MQNNDRTHYFAEKVQIEKKHVSRFWFLTLSFEYDSAWHKAESQLSLVLFISQL